jgi:hypothetical protein
MGSTVSGKESRGNQGFRSGEQTAVSGGLERGDQVATGDDLGYGVSATSGDGGTPVGNRLAAGDRGSTGGGSVSVEHYVPGPITPSISIATPIDPMLSPELVALASEVGHDQAIVDRFVLDFLSLLDERLHRIASHLAARDDAAATVALLSLETTGAMIGAADLVSSVAQLRSAVNEHRRDELDVRTAWVVETAEALRVRLRQHAVNAGLN